MKCSCDEEQSSEGLQGITLSHKQHIRLWAYYERRCFYPELSVKQHVPHTLCCQALAGRKPLHNNAQCRSLKTRFITNSHLQYRQPFYSLTPRP